MPVADPDQKDPDSKRAYSLGELANLYKVTRKTMRRWLDKIKAEVGPREGRYFNFKQVNIIFDHLGNPFIWLFALCLKILAWNFFDDHDDDDNGNQGHHPNGHYDPRNDPRLRRY